jgi:uncharacterized membrane protein
MKEKHYRSFVKGVSYRIIGTITTVVISYLMTGNTGTALSIGLADVLVKIVIYYLHERAWNRIPLGKHQPPSADYQI